MKKGYKIIILILFVILISILIYAYLIDRGTIRNYHIKDFEIDVTLKGDGNIHVKEETEYRFNGEYNGITITIPTNVSEKLYNKLTQDSMNDSKLLPDSLYTSSGIEDVVIYTIENGMPRYIKRVNKAVIGDKGVYTVEEENGFTTYVIYEPATSENKKIVIEYTLKDVMVKHNDSAELFWNFVGGAVECNIKDLRINIYGTNILEAYTHGNASGTIENTADAVKINYSNVKPGEFVSARVILDKNQHSYKKQTNIDALPIIEELEESYTNKKNTIVILSNVAFGVTFAMLVYWMILLIKFEKEIEPRSLIVDDIDILDKYNPMIAACIAQNRGMHPRDILAVLIDLVNIKALTMVHIRGDVIGSNNDKYQLTKNKAFFNAEDKYKKLDEIQKSVIDVFFGGCNEIELTRRLEDMKYATYVSEQMKNLDDKATTKLDELGANCESVPRFFQIFNNILFIISCIYIVIMLAYNISLRSITLSQTMDGSILLPIVLYIVFTGIFGAVPIAMYGVQAIITFANFLRRNVSKITFKLTTKKLTRRLILILAAGVIAITIQLVFVKDYVLLVATLLFFVSLLIILTDNLMTQHKQNIINEYLELKLLEDKIANGSLLEEKKIQDSVLWGKYFSYAIALGVGDVAKYIKYIPDFSEMDNIINTFNAITDGGFKLYNLDKEIDVKVKISRYKSSLNRRISKPGRRGGYSKSSRGFSSRSFSSGGRRFSGGGGRGGGRGAF